MTLPLISRYLCSNIKMMGFELLPLPDGGPSCHAADGASLLISISLDTHPLWRLSAPMLQSQ